MILVPEMPHKNYRTKKSTKEARYATAASAKSLVRLTSISDPITKYGMYIDIIRLGIDFGLTYMDEYHKDLYEEIQEEIEEYEKKIEDFVEGENEGGDVEVTMNDLKKSLKNLHTAERDVNEILENIKTIIKNSNNYMEGFSDWIRQPIYSPDHPYGETVMKKTKKEFKEKVSSNE